jgi:hypothetical protein
MNLGNSPTVEELRDLLRSCDDYEGDHILWVAKNGDVHLSLASRDDTSPGVKEAAPEMQLWYETFEAGNEYVGPDAAGDFAWVKQLFDALVKNWPNAKGRQSVEYVGQF